MPDYIDTMMYVGEIPWHKQGTMVHEAPSIKDAIELAGLEWEVRKAPTYFEVNKEDSRYYQNLGEKFWNLGSVKKSYHNLHTFCRSNFFLFKQTPIFSSVRP